MPIARTLLMLLLLSISAPVHAEPVDSAGVLTPTMRLKGHTDSVATLDWSNDGKWIASGSVDNTVRLWDAATGKLTQTLKVFRGAVIEVRFSGDSKRLIVGSVDGSAKVFDTATGKQLAQFRFRQPAWRVAINQDGTKVAISTRAEGSGVYDVATENFLFAWDEPSPATSIAFSPDANLLAVSVQNAGQAWAVSGQHNARELFFDDAGKKVGEWPVESAMGDLRFDADSQFVFGWPSLKNFLRIDRNGPKVVAEASMGMDFGCNRIADNAMTTVVLPGEVVRVIRFDGPTAKVEELQTTTADVRCGAISADGKRFALGPSDLPDGQDLFKPGRPAEKCVIDIYSAESPQKIAAAVATHIEVANKFYRDGISILPGTATAWVPGNGPLQVIELSTGKVLGKKPKRSNSYMAVAFSPDGKQAVLSQPTGPTIVDAETCTTIAKLAFNAARSIPQVMAGFIDDGKKVVIANGARWDRGAARPSILPRGLWAVDAVTGQRIGTLDNEQFPVWAIADDSKSRRVVVTTATYMDGPAKAAMRIFDATTWAVVKVVPLPENKEHSKVCVVNGVAYACNGGDLVRYDLARDRMLEPIELQPNGQYTDLAVSGDQKRLLVGGNKIATLVDVERGERTKSFNLTSTGPRRFGFDGNRPFTVMLDDDKEQSWDFLWLEAAAN